MRGCGGFAAAYAGRPQYRTSARCCLPFRRCVTFHLHGVCVSVNPAYTSRARILHAPLSQEDVVPLRSRVLDEALAREDDRAAQIRRLLELEEVRAAHRGIVHPFDVHLYMEGPHQRNSSTGARVLRQLPHGGSAPCLSAARP